MNKRGLFTCIDYVTARSGFQIIAIKARYGAFFKIIMNALQFGTLFLLVSVY